MILNDKILSLSPYDPSKDKYAVKLDANESFISLPTRIVDKMMDAFRSAEFNRYPDPSCSALREAAAGHYRVPAENIVAGNGSDELISLITNTFNMKGDRILIVEPDFSMYSFYAHLAECETVIYHKNDALNIDTDVLIDIAKREKVNMLIFSNPCNPTGQGIPATDIMRIINSLDCLVVIDEAYMEFWNESILDTVCKTENALVLKTCSKSFGLAAVRLGFAIGSDRLINCLNRARSPYNINMLSQYAGETLLNEHEYLAECAKRITESENELTDKLSRLKLSLIPTVTNFSLISDDNANVIYEKLLKKDICIRVLRGRYLRVTAGMENENRALCLAIKEVLEEMGR